MQLIDAHAHFAGDTPEAIELIRKWDLRFLNICYDGSAHDAPDEDCYKQADRYAELTRNHPDIYAWVTAFEAAPFEAPGFADRTIEKLDADFARGAIGCKIWKNIGLDLHKSNGDLLMPDDEIFDPIYKFLVARGMPLQIHIGEPWEFWQPLREGSVHSEYITNHPQYHFYKRKEIPSHAHYIQVRDNIMEKHPDLLLVGLHLGSMEYDVDEVAKRFDRYPNFIVDTAGPARTRNLMVQDQGKVREFLLKYQDRIMFGTDILNDLMLSEYTPEEQAAQLAKFDAYYNLPQKYYGTTETVTMKDVTSTGLGLPHEVMRKLFCENAERWYKGWVPAEAVAGHA